MADFARLLLEAPIHYGPPLGQQIADLLHCLYELAVGWRAAELAAGMLISAHLHVLAYTTLRGAAGMSHRRASHLVSLLHATIMVYLTLSIASGIVTPGKGTLLLSMSSDAAVSFSVGYGLYTATGMLLNPPNAAELVNFAIAFLVELCVLSVRGDVWARAELVVGVAASSQHAPPLGAGVAAG